MALSDIGHAVLISTVASALNLRLTNLPAFRTAVVTYLHNKYPSIPITTADLIAQKVVIVIDTKSGYVGFGRGISDALDAIKAKTG